MKTVDCHMCGKETDERKASFVLGDYVCRECAGKLIDFMDNNPNELQKLRGENVLLRAILEHMFSDFDNCCSWDDMIAVARRAEGHLKRITNDTHNS